MIKLLNDLKKYASRHPPPRAVGSLPVGNPAINSNGNQALGCTFWSHARTASYELSRIARVHANNKNNEGCTLSYSTI